MLSQTTQEMEKAGVDEPVVSKIGNET